MNFGFDSAFLNLFNAYLTNRSQCVKINQSFSSRLPVTSVVPQGSVLGPLLFIIFVNDIADDAANGCFHLFADDLKIFSTSTFSLVQEDNNSLFNWCNLNGLHFHPSKCKAVNFGGHDFAIFFLGSDYLPFNKQIEDLGFIVSSTLSWKAHLDSKLLNCKRIFNFLKRNIPFSVSSHRKLLLYRSFIMPIFLYGAPIWSPSLTTLHQIERFQYKVLRWIIRCSSYVSGLESLQLLPVCYSLIRDDIVFLWKLYNGAVDVQCNFHFTTLPTRSSSNALFRVPKARKISSEDNFLYEQLELQTSSSG